METKNITIVKPGSGENTQSNAYDITVQAGTTGQQVVEQLGLGCDYNLTKGDGKPMDMAMDLFPQVANGEKLFATTAATVGRLVA